MVNESIDHTKWAAHQIIWRTTSVNKIVEKAMKSSTERVIMNLFEHGD